MEVLIVFLTLGLALLLFAWGKIRHDIVATLCLLVLVVSGIIPSNEAFLGFAHPAVITVAMILIVSKGMQKSGLIDLIGQKIMKIGNKTLIQIAVLCITVCVASAFMNNVGALAILMPIAINIAKKNNQSPSIYLMPIAFASLLGGMTTLIGTPPNIIISSYRAELSGEPFGMFAFTPVGIGVALAGLIFLILAGWKLIPIRISKNGNGERFNIEDYITEVLITKKSNIHNQPLSDIKKITESDYNILNIIRDNHLIHAPDMSLILKENDIITIEADADDLKSFIEKTKVELVGKVSESENPLGSENISVVEAVVMNDAPIFNQTASGLRMRARFGVNLLAISRQNKRIRKRLDHVKFQVGDVLLLQGDASKIDDTLNDMGCLPLADRGFNLSEKNQILMAFLIFFTSVIAIISGLAEVQIAFTAAALLMVFTGIINVREIYTSVDWPVIVLLGALLPVGAAMETSGGTQMIADIIIKYSGKLEPWAILGMIITISLLLSGIINNAATVVLMAPLAISIATDTPLSKDAVLMAVAIGSSCAFLTPIGHQSNTLVMGPGGYKFTDYTIMGLPLTIIIIFTSIPLLLYFFPLN
jgi:di/tricarboxylate transporter